MRLEKEIIKYFGLWQKSEGKYSDLDITDVEMKEVPLENVADFPAKTRISGKVDKTISEYKELVITEKEDFFPLVSGTVENNQISGYIHKSRIKENSLSKPHAISWTRINSQFFFIQPNPVCTNDDSFVLEVKDDFDVSFIHKSTETKMKSTNFHWGNKAGKNKIKIIKILIPKDLNKTYTSYKLQQILVEFLEYYHKHLETYKNVLKPTVETIDKFEKALMNKIFQNDKDSFLVEKFNFWLEEKKEIKDLIFEEIVFEGKKIISDDDSEVLCQKRMGFTPERTESGDINWFTVADLTAQEGLYINDPKTKERTSMELIKAKVDSKNTGKSEKLIPIKKGDILVSFLLTIGCTKIYNSDKSSYCNQAIDILTLKEGFDEKYVAYNCILEYPKSGEVQALGKNLNDDEKAKINIPIPKPTKNYTSLELQKLLVEYIEAFVDWKEQMKAYDVEMRELATAIQEVFLAKTFRGDV